MKLSKHKVFLSICGVNVLVWLLSCAFPDILNYLALDTDHPYRLYSWITCIFAHAGIHHLVGNTLFVLPWAWYLEPKIGGDRFLGAWIITGVAGSIAWLLTPALLFGGASLGSSGADMGIMACAVMLMEGHLIIRLAALGLFLLIGLDEYQGTVITALVPDGVGHAAHIGGIYCGILIAQFISAARIKRLTPLRVRLRL